MKQQLPSIREHGGSLAVGRARKRRPLSSRQPIHQTLSSQRAIGPRSLLNNATLIRKIAASAAKRFDITIYALAICPTHLHICLRGKSTEGLRNFFRVFAGHTAQKILKLHPCVYDPLPVTSCKKN